MVVNFSRGATPGVDHQVGHGVGDRDERVAPGRCPTFAESEDFPGQWALIRMERRAVDRMHHGRHVQRGGGHAAEDAGLGAVGVDHVGLEATDRGLNVSIGERVGQRSDLSLQSWRNFQRHSPCPGPRQQVAFVQARRPSQQQHVVAVAVQEILAAQQRVFLRAAEHEPGDDMEDFHGLLDWSIVLLLGICGEILFLLSLYHSMRGVLWASRSSLAGA